MVSLQLLWLLAVGQCKIDARAIPPSLSRSPGSLYLVVAWAMPFRWSAGSGHTSNTDLGVKSHVGNQIASEEDRDGIQTFVPVNERGQGSHSATSYSGEVPIRGCF